MNTEVTIRQEIENALKNFNNQPLREAATTLLNTLGYYSKRVGNDGIDNDRFERLKAAATETDKPDRKLCIDEWQAFYQIMQITDDEINEQTPSRGSLFESTAIDTALLTSYMFVTVQLSKKTYTRTQLADITRFISRHIPQPILVIFRYGDVLTLAIINRRQHKRDPSKQVLEKVTLIKDINLEAPKRAHIDILSELHLHRLMKNEGVDNFDDFHKAWENIFMEVNTMRDAPDTLIKETSNLLEEIIPVLSGNIQILQNDLNPQGGMLQYLLQKEIELQKSLLQRTRELNEKVDQYLNSQPTEDHLDPRMGPITVVMSDGKQICCRFGSDTFVKVIEEIGIERVKELGMTTCRIPLIDTSKSDELGGQKPSGDYYIMTRVSNNEKRKLLKEIGRRLGDDIKVL